MCVHGGRQWTSVDASEVRAQEVARRGDASRHRLERLRPARLDDLGQIPLCHGETLVPAGRQGRSYPAGHLSGFRYFHGPNAPSPLVTSGKGEGEGSGPRRP